MTNYVKQDNDIVFDVYYKYDIKKEEILTPDKKSYYVNTRGKDYVEGKRYDVDERPEIDVMKEEQIGKVETKIDNKYKIREAKTFDVKIATEYEYIMYLQKDVDNRVNPDKYNETIKSIYEEKDMNNRLITSGQKIKGTVLSDFLKGKTIGDIDSRFNVTSNQFKDKLNSIYNQLQYMRPGQYIRDIYKTTVLSSDLDNIGENINSNGKYSELPATISMEYSNEVKEYKNFADTRTIKVNCTNNYKKKAPYIIREGKEENKMGTHYITRTWVDKLTTKSVPQSMYSEEDLIDFNAEYNSVLNNTTKDVEKNKYLNSIKDSTKNYKEYKELGAAKKLNNIDFINSNENIYNSYLVNNDPQSKIRGYDRKWLEYALEELKSLFEKTAKEKGKTPYVYGISLGLVSLVSQPSQNSLSSIAGSIFSWPTDNPYIACIQGKSAIYGENAHDGVDIWGYYNENNKDPNNLYWDERNRDYSVAGPPVYAIADGIVHIVDNNMISDGNYTNTNQLGNYIYIEHDLGDNKKYVSRYAHLYDDSYTVTEGQQVKRGQQIASVGSSGNSSCMHLHFNIFDNNDGNGIKFSNANRLDPLTLYTIMPTEINEIPYVQISNGTADRNKINNFNMYMFDAYSGGSILPEGSPLPAVTEDEKKELVANLDNTYLKNNSPDPSKLWLFQYCTGNTVELIARLMYAELVVTDRNSKCGIFAIVAQTKAFWNYCGRNAENMLKVLTTSGYLAPTTFVSNNFMSENIPLHYRQIAAAVISDTLPNPPGFEGGELYWIGSSDLYGNHHAWKNQNKQTCGYQSTPGGSFHVFLTKDQYTDPHNLLIDNGYYGINPAYEIAPGSGVFTDPKLDANTVNSAYDKIMKDLDKYQPT